MDRLGLGFGHKLSVGQWWRIGGVLELAVELQSAGAGVAVVEAEAELFQVRLQMRGVDSWVNRSLRAVG